MKSEDLLAAVFPDQVACLENIVGEREIPDHPLVNQTLHDCLREAMDVDGLLHILHGLEDGSITVVARDLAAPSPLAGEVLGAAPYAYLDDAPLEERRTQAVQSRRWTDVDSADDLGRLDAEAIAAVREEAWPQVRCADEMHEALGILGAITQREAEANAGWSDWLAGLAKSHRATRLSLTSKWADGAGATPEEASPASVWTSAEKLPLWQTVHPDAALVPAITAPAEFASQTWTREDALLELVRGRLTGCGPVTVAQLASALQVASTDIDLALLRLQSEGYVMQGHFTPATSDLEWCERHLLARIHRYTMGRLRREIEPVSRRDLMRFLFEWQHVAPGSRLSGPDALPAVLTQLEGYEAAAGAWETELLPARIDDYAISWLDDLCRAGRVSWSRLRTGSGGGGGPVRATPIVLLPRRSLPIWTGAASGGGNLQEVLISSRAQAVLDALRDEGASFFDELLHTTRLLRTELEDALGELVAAGRITADSFAGLRALLVPAAKRDAHRHRRLRRHMLTGIEDAGRWSLVRSTSLLPFGEKVPGRAGEGRVLAKEVNRAAKNAPAPQPKTTPIPPNADAIEHIARSLLRRYGVVFWKLLEREAPWLPTWRELLRVYHRLEARGEIRGGRFVEGLVGEQFALPEAVARLRAVRQSEPQNELVCIGGHDPLNLVGTVLAGNKLPAVIGTRVLYEDGVPVAALVASKPQWLVEASPAQQQHWRNALLGRAEHDSRRAEARAAGYSL